MKYLLLSFVLITTIAVGDYANSPIPFSLSSPPKVNVIFQDDFESGEIPSGKNLYFRSETETTLTVSSNTAVNYGNSKGSLRGTYPATFNTGGNYIWSIIKIPQRDVNEIFIEFKAKMPSNKLGNTFLKVFGQYSSNTGYANTTFRLDPETGEMYAVGFGDGDVNGDDNVKNESDNVILFGGDYLNWMGRSYGVADVKLPQKKSFQWDNEWHHFRFMVRYHSGNSKATEKPDGAYYVEIDGKVYVDTKNFYNRHYLNLPIDKIELFGLARGGKKPFEQLYDDVIITTGNFLTNPISK